MSRRSAAGSLPAAISIEDEARLVLSVSAASRFRGSDSPRRYSSSACQVPITNRSEKSITSCCKRRARFAGLIFSAGVIAGLGWSRCGKRFRARAWLRGAITMSRRRSRRSLARKSGEIWQSLFNGGSLGIPGDYVKLIDAPIALNRSGRQAGLGESKRDLRIVLKADQDLVCFRG